MSLKFLYNFLFYCLQLMLEINLIKLFGLECILLILTSCSYKRFIENWIGKDFILSGFKIIKYKNVVYIFLLLSYSISCTSISIWVLKREIRSFFHFASIFCLFCLAALLSQNTVRMSSRKHLCKLVSLLVPIGPRWPTYTVALPAGSVRPDSHKRTPEHQDRRAAETE